MQETQISVRSEDKSPVIAAFFLGIATSLFIVIYWISFTNVLVFSFISLATLVIFLTIAILLAQPRKTKKVVRVSKIDEPVKPLNPERVDIAVSPVKPIKQPKKRGRPKKSSSKK